MDEEKKVWETHKGEKVTVVRYILGKPLYYTGIIKEITEEKLIFEDRKIGNMVLCFRDLEITRIFPNEN